MDRTAKSVCVCAAAVCLLTVCSQAHEATACPCPPVPPLQRTEPPPPGCYSDTFRYTCERGHVRRAGTSNQIRCRTSNGSPRWSSPTLKCIPDPRRTETPPTGGPVPGSSTGPQTPSEIIQTRAPVGSEPGPTDPGSYVGPTPGFQPTTAAAAIGGAVLTVTCVLAGILFLCYRRRSRRSTPVATEEEQIQMNPVPAPQ